MKKLIILGGGVAASVSLALLGSPMASADDYAGQTYADASQAISDSGGTAVVGTRFGDKLSQDECIVVGSAAPSFVRAMTTDVYFETVSSEVWLNLNCNGGYATATNPGPSMLSPAGRDAKAAEDEAAAQEEQALEAVSTPGA